VAGLRLVDKSTGIVVAYGSNGWEAGVVRASQILVDGQQVVGARSGAILDPSGGTTADPEARLAIIAILSALRQHGLIST
jgi:hypothetical protein